jgi:hypothetical protein
MISSTAFNVTCGMIRISSPDFLLPGFLLLCAPPIKSMTPRDDHSVTWSLKFRSLLMRSSTNYSRASRAGARSSSCTRSNSIPLRVRRSPRTPRIRARRSPSTADALVCRTCYCATVHSGSGLPSCDRRCPNKQLVAMGAMDSILLPLPLPLPLLKSVVLLVERLSKSLSLTEQLSHQ